MRIKIILFVIISMISLQAATAYGMGVGVSPGNMSFKLAPGTSAEQPLYVINTGNESSNYDVFVNESAYQNWFTISPSSFSLKAGEQKEVKVNLKVPASAETNVKCKIKIPCTVPGKTVGAGIIVPVQIEIYSLGENSSEGAASGSSSSVEKGTQNTSSKTEVEELLQRFLENKSDSGSSFTHNITDLGEKLKESTESLKVIGSKNIENVSQNFNSTIKSIDNITESFDSAIKSIGNITKSFYSTITGLGSVIKNLGKKDPTALAIFEGCEQKLQALPGFDAPLVCICLAISGLLMRRQMFK